MRLAVLLLACAVGLAGPVRARPASPLDLVRVRNGALAMGPVSLGATRREVERRLGRPIAVAPGAREGCGGGESEVLVRGRRVSVSWSGVTPDVTRHGPVEPTMASLRLRTRPDHDVPVMRNGGWTCLEGTAHPRGPRTGAF